MTSLPSLRRGLAALISVAVFAGVLAVAALSGRPASADKAQLFDVAPHTLPMFGGGIFRNPVNTTEKNVPDDWSVEEGNFKNVKWVQDLGSKAYGGPIIADGKIFIGTNNAHPRNPKVTGDKGIV